MSEDDGTNGERRVNLNVDNFNGAGSRRKSRRIVNEECVRKLKESNRWKIKEENDRQLREEEERIIFVEVLRRIQKRDDLKMRDEFYDIDKLRELNKKAVSALEGEAIMIEGLDFSALNTEEIVTIMKDSPLNNDFAAPADSEENCTTSLTAMTPPFDNKRRSWSDKEKNSGDETDRRITDKEKKRSERELKIRDHSFRSNRSISAHSLTQEIFDEGIVDRLREGIEKNMHPKKKTMTMTSNGGKSPGGGNISISDESNRNPRAAAGAFVKPMLIPTRSKLMEEYEKNIKVEIDIKVAMAKEKKIRTKDDINVIIKTTKNV